MTPLIAILVMAFFTYLTRALPMILIRQEIKSVRIRSFLHYIPFAILAAMTVPYIFYATTHITSAIVGTCIALVLAWYKKSLITVSMVAVAGAWLVELLL